MYHIKTLRDPPVVHGLNVVLEVGITLEESVGPADPAVEGQVIRIGVLDAVLPLLMPGRHNIIVNLLFVDTVQGDHSACGEPPVDFRTKVPFWPGFGLA